MKEHSKFHWVRPPKNTAVEQSEKIQETEPRNAEGPGPLKKLRPMIKLPKRERPVERPEPVKSKQPKPSRAQAEDVPTLKNPKEFLTEEELAAATNLVHEAKNAANREQALTKPAVTLQEPTYNSSARFTTRFEEILRARGVKKAAVPSEEAGVTVTAETVAVKRTESDTAAQHELPQSPPQEKGERPTSLERRGVLLKKHGDAKPLGTNDSNELATSIERNIQFHSRRKVRSFKLHADEVAEKKKTAESIHRQADARRMERANSEVKTKELVAWHQRALKAPHKATTPENFVNRMLKARSPAAAHRIAFELYRTFVSNFEGEWAAEGKSAMRTQLQTRSKEDALTALKTITEHFDRYVEFQVTPETKGMVRDFEELNRLGLIMDELHEEIVSRRQITPPGSPPSS